MLKMILFITNDIVCTFPVTEIVHFKTPVNVMQSVIQISMFMQCYMYSESALGSFEFILPS